MPGRAGACENMATMFSSGMTHMDQTEGRGRPHREAALNGGLSVLGTPDSLYLRKWSWVNMVEDVVIISQGIRNSSAV